MTQLQDSRPTDGAAPPKRGPGRPRHADTEERAYRAVLELFGRKGWSGVSLEGVAQQSGVGKSSIYLRWKDKRELLLDAIKDMESKHVNPDDSLPIREYLIAYGRARGELFLGEHGNAIANIFSAAFANPVEFRDIREESISRGVLAAVSRIERAIADGELPAGTSADPLRDAVEGAVFFHIIISPPSKSHEELSAGLEDYVTELVDMLLRGLQR